VIALNKRSTLQKTAPSGPATQALREIVAPNCA